jgi:hypothetical protein
MVEIDLILPWGGNIRLRNHRNCRRSALFVREYSSRVKICFGWASAYQITMLQGMQTSLALGLMTLTRKGIFCDGLLRPFERG